MRKKTPPHAHNSIAALKERLPTVFLHDWYVKTSLLQKEGAVAQHCDRSTLSKIQHKFLNEVETGPEAVRRPTLKRELLKYTASDCHTDSNYPRNPSSSKEPNTSCSFKNSGMGAKEQQSCCNSRRLPRNLQAPCTSSHRTRVGTTGSNFLWCI